MRRSKTSQVIRATWLFALVPIGMTSASSFFNAERQVDEVSKRRQLAERMTARTAQLPPSKGTYTSEATFSSAALTARDAWLLHRQATYRVACNRLIWRGQARKSSVCTAASNGYANKPLISVKSPRTMARTRRTANASDQQQPECRNLSA